jgi:hypothetical protein
MDQIRHADRLLVDHSTGCGKTRIWAVIIPAPRRGRRRGTITITISISITIIINIFNKMVSWRIFFLLTTDFPLSD